MKGNDEMAARQPRTIADPALARDGMRRPLSRLGLLIHDVSRMRRALFDERMQPVGATRAQWRTLAVLSRAGQAGMTQTELAQGMEMGRAAIGALIDRLEANGYVQRVRHPEDRRANRIVMTAEADRILTQLNGVGGELADVITAGISPEDLATAERVLARMKINIRGALHHRGAWAADDEPA